MKSLLKLLLSGSLLLTHLFSAQSARPPIMGWSSWNNFRINISEQLIKEQADALISSGLYDLGYRYINIDDGFFGGRDSLGNLLVNEKFPSGMKSLVEYLHSKGLKAGIYSDAGEDTCGSVWDNDRYGVGVGLHNHLQQDLNLYFKVWGFDFIKVDWCGGEKLKLNEQETYTQIISAVKQINPDITFNICRWKFPGDWAINLADSWRISGDIAPDFGTILHIIDLNQDLYPYASAGHYNDMDMLQVGRGMTHEEDKSHFSMWALLNSPLLAGNDLRNMSAQTLEILSNKEIIRLNQDTEFRQARKIITSGKIEIWEKELSKSQKAFAILNRGEATRFSLKADEIKLSPEQKIRDLWAHKDLGAYGSVQTFELPTHGIVVFKTL